MLRTGGELEEVNGIWSLCWGRGEVLSKHLEERRGLVERLSEESAPWNREERPTWGQRGRCLNGGVRGQERGRQIQKANWDRLATQGQASYNKHFGFMPRELGC